MENFSTWKRSMTQKMLWTSDIDVRHNVSTKYSLVIIRYPLIIVIVFCCFLVSLIVRSYWIITSLPDLRIELNDSKCMSIHNQILYPLRHCSEGHQQRDCSFLYSMSEGFWHFFCKIQHWMLRIQYKCDCHWSGINAGICTIKTGLWVLLGDKKETKGLLTLKLI